MAIVSHSAEEIQGLFADNSVITTQIFIIPKALSGLHIFVVELTGDIGWSLWNKNRQTLYIGISEMAFEDAYTLPIHETAKLLELFWWPPDRKHPKTIGYVQKAMPHFLPIATSGNGPLTPNQLAIYDILAHEIAHYWNRTYDSNTGVYAGADSEKADPNAPSVYKCPKPCDSLTAGTFPAISWTDYVPEPADFDPPWSPAGIWGYSIVDATVRLQGTLTTSTPHLPDDGGIQVWPSATVTDFLNDLYGGGLSNPFPTAQAVTSPLEDFAESYTMFALYRVGLRSLCLLMPNNTATPPTNDVMFTLFRNGAPFRAKVDSLTGIATGLNGGYGITVPTDYPSNSGCP